MLITLLSKYQHQYDGATWRYHYKLRNDEWINEWIWDMFLKGMTLIFAIFILSIVWILIKAFIDALKELE